MRTNRGVTLIEMMIAVAVVAILATIALPAYQDQVRKSRRADAQTALMDLQLRQERHRANNTSYGSLAQIGGAPASNYYTYQVSDEQANAYTVTATAVAGSSQVHDKAKGVSCSPLTLDQDSIRTPSECW